MILFIISSLFYCLEFGANARKIRVDSGEVIKTEKYEKFQFGDLFDINKMHKRFSRRRNKQNDENIKKKKDWEKFKLNLVSILTATIRLVYIFYKINKIDTGYALGVIVITLFIFYLHYQDTLKDKPKKKKYIYAAIYGLVSPGFSEISIIQNSVSNNFGE